MTGKIAGPKGQYCPLVKRDCSHPKACQSCMFWRPLQVTRGAETGPEWDCAFAWPIMTQGIMNQRLDVVAQSTQQMRNQFAEMKETMGQLIAKIAMARQLAMAPPPPQRTIALQAEDGEEQRSNQP